jgi:transcriptional regulator with XRE-family HTH domain
MASNKSPRTQLEKDNLNLLGTHIRLWREKQGLTQEQFAPIAGLPRSYVTEIETGKRNVSFLNLVKIITALGVSDGEVIALFHEVAKKKELNRNNE